MAKDAERPRRKAAPDDVEDNGGEISDEEFDRLYERKGWLIHLTKQLGGAVTAVAVGGRYAYVGKGYRLLVVDLTDLVHPALVGHSPTLDEMVRQVVVAGSLAVVVTFRSVYLFDVSVPATPAPRSRIPMAMERGSVALYLPYLYITGFSNDDGEAEFTFDVSDPANPVRLAASPRRSGDFGPGGRIAGTIQYRAFGDDLLLYNYADPLHPRQVGSVTLPAVIESATAVGQYAYVAAGDGLHVLNCAEPAHPAECFYFLTGSGAEQVLIAGQTACVVCSFAGVYTFDIQDPAAPVPLAHFGCPDLIEASAAGDGFLCLAGTGPLPRYSTRWTKYGVRERGFMVIDLHDPRRPIARPFDLGLFHAKAVATDGDRAYVIDGRDAYAGLRCLDLAQECDFGERSWIALEQPSSSVAASGSFALVVTDGGLVVYDFADSKRPRKRGGYGTDAHIAKIIMHGRFAHIAAGNELHVVSVTNPDRPRRLASLRFPSPLFDIAVADGRIIALLEDGLHVLQRKGRTISELGNWPSTKRRHAVAVTSNWALLIGGNGLTVVDLADPEHPCQVGRGRTMRGWDSGADLVTLGRFALYHDWDHIIALDLADPRQPTTADYFITWDYEELIPNQLSTDGVRCFVAAQESGLLMLELGTEGNEASARANEALPPV